jgi:hypothetical protein
MRSYSSVLESLAEKGPTKSLRKPTFRTSAIFPALNLPGVATRICFVGYWMIKRRIPELTAVLTVRSEDGRIVGRTTHSIREAKAYRFELVDQLTAAAIPADTEFRGSLEIEFFSSRDLVFPFPAVIVNYYGPTFSSFVHTAQRVFNDIEDAREVLETSVPESGFNIYVDEDREPFFAIINGFEPVPDCRVQMEFYNHQGEGLQHDLRVGALKPYQMVLVHPADLVNLKSFLGGRVGTAKVQFNARWVFPRIVAGNRQRSLDALSITHTFYDCTKATTPADYWTQRAANRHPAALLVPLTTTGNRFTNVYFYPIFSPSTIEIDVEIYDADGRLLGKAPKAHKIVSPNTELHQIPLKDLCHQLGIPASKTHSAKIIARPVDGSSLPARLKLGLDLGLDDTKLPCNICVGLEPYNAAVESKPRAFRWAPLLADQPGAVVWFLNGSPAIDYQREALIDVVFYRESDDTTLARTLQLPPNGAATIRLGDDPELSTFLGGKVGWFTATSPNPHFNTFYFVEHPLGIVGGDHGF